MTYRRTRRLSLRIGKDGDVRVSVPWGVPKNVVERFVEEHREWIEKARANTLQRTAQRDRFYEQLPLGSKAQKEEAAHKLALLVEPMVTKHAGEMGVRPTNITYKPLKSKWGYCQVQIGAICLSTYLLLLPEKCIEHVVVHEMCHLLQTGHGPRFHALMDRFFPDWKTCDKEVKRLMR